ncbi:uncharacterized protein LOC142329261 isoform X2 [Lycorma delicatula]|uniref:uncharacterized protein LOC142329261 isoform X2 n=1 Tax=Lycorma delicatula TaxID=130591 RepID=UPI003F516D02
MQNEEKITGQNENKEREEKIPLLTKLSSGQSICRKIAETFIYIDGGMNDEQKTEDEDKKENESLLETLTGGSKICRRIAETLIQEGKEAEEKIPFLKTLSSGQKMCTKLAEKFMNADSGVQEQDENEKDDGNMSLSNVLSSGEEACKKLAENVLDVEVPQTPINYHSYQQKKNWSHGMMDIALLSSHIGTVKSLLQHPFGNGSGFFYSIVTFVSIFIQILVGVGLIWNGRYDLNKPGNHHRKAHLLNNCTFSGTIAITVMNVILSALGVPTIPTNMHMPMLPGNMTFNIADIINKIS